MQGRQVQDVGNGIRDLCILLFFSWFCGLVGLGKGQMEDVLLHTMELKSRFLRKVYETTTKKKGKNKHTNKRKEKKKCSLMTKLRGRHSAESNTSEMDRKARSVTQR